MHCISIYWSDKKDETIIRYSKNFQAEHYVTRLDILKDALHDLEVEYENIYIEGYGTDDADLFTAPGYLPDQQVSDEQAKASDKTLVQIRRLSLVQPPSKKPSQP
jgi:hypothetical protein